MKLKRLCRKWFPSILKPELGEVSDDFRHNLIARLNFEREKQAYQDWLSGKEFFYVPLNRDARLEHSAQQHAEYMSKYELLTDGHRCNNTFTRITQSGYSCRRYKDCSENLSSYDGSPYGVIIDWMRHEGCRANILNYDWVDIGIGMSKARSGLKYWCAKFARPYVFEDLVLMDEELFELLSHILPNDEDLMKFNLRRRLPKLENLEGRQMLAANVMSTLANGTLAIVGTNQADSIRISNPTPTTVQLDIAGQISQSWPTTAVNNLVVNSLNGDDAVINLTTIPSTIIAGNGNSYIDSGNPAVLGVNAGGNDVIRVGNGNNIIQDSGGKDIISAGNGNNVIFGFGQDTIVAGNGNNVLYNIVGSGTITAGKGQNRVITNANFMVSIGKNSYPTVTFQTRANPVTLDANGVLYFAGTAGNDTVLVDDNGDGTITTNYTNQTGVTVTNTFNKSQVKAIASVLGTGDDTIVNNTKIDTVAYGAAGNDTLLGGDGFNLLKGGAGNDTIQGGASLNILTGDGGADVLIGGTRNNDLLAGFDLMDTVISTGKKDIIVGDVATVVLSARQTKIYN